MPGVAAGAGRRAFLESADEARHAGAVRQRLDRRACSSACRAIRCRCWRPSSRSGARCWMDCRAGRSRADAGARGWRRHGARRTSDWNSCAAAWTAARTAACRSRPNPADGSHRLRAAAEADALIVLAGRRARLRRRATSSKCCRTDAPSVRVRNAGSGWAIIAPWPFHEITPREAHAAGSRRAPCWSTCAKTTNAHSAWPKARCGIARAELEADPSSASAGPRRRTPADLPERRPLDAGGRRRCSARATATSPRSRGGTSRWISRGLADRKPAVEIDHDFTERYSRHLRCRKSACAGRSGWKLARVLVVGAGGLGSPAAFYLAAAGVGTLRIADDDVVDRSNLQRQILHTDARIGMRQGRFGAKRAVRAESAHAHRGDRRTRHLRERRAPARRTSTW